MRPILLEIEGLQSFTLVQRINFEHLSETGLFGIFGPTGSGKSTILDAITFALYGKVKRAESGTQGIINTNLNTARVAFTFELTTGGARKTYRVERTYQRKNNSPNSCEPKVVRLIEVTQTGEIPILDKATEVSNYIRDLLGLSHEDFTRAVVLPQNSFQEFLLLSNKDRRGMLERIFYLEEYGRKLTDKLILKISGLKSKLDVLSGELKGYQDASDEALEEARKAMEEANKEKEAVYKKLTKLQKKYDEAKEVWSLVEELREFNEKEEKHLSINQEISEKRQRLEKAQKAEGILDLIKKNKELEEKLAQTEKDLQAANGKLPEVEAELSDKKEKYNVLKIEMAAETPKLMELKTRLTDAIIIKNELEAMTNKISSLSDEISDLAKKANTKKEELDKETTEFQSLARSIEELEAECEAHKTAPEYRQQIQQGTVLESRVKELETDVKGLADKLTPLRNAVSDFQKKLDSVRADISSSLKEQERILSEIEKLGQSVPGDRNKIFKDMEDIHNISQTNEVLKLKSAEIKELQDKLSEQKKDIEREEQKKAELIKIKEEALKEYEKCVSENEAINEKLSQSRIYALSEKLKEGEPCPVCGSKHHPGPARNIHGDDMALLAQQAEKAKKKLEEADAALKSAEGDILHISGQLKIKQQQYQQTLEYFRQKEAQYKSEAGKLPEKLRGLSPDQIKKEIEWAKKEYEESLKAIESREAEQEKYKNELSELKDKIAKQRAIENGIAAELKVTLENVTQTEKDLSDTQKALEDAREQNAAFLQKYRITSALAELERISENDRQLDSLQKSLRSKKEAQEAKRNLLDKLKEELSSLNSEILKLKTEADSLKKQSSEKKNKLTELAGDADIGEEAAKVDERLKTYSKLEKGLQQEIEKLDESYNKLRTEKSLLENQRRIYSESLKAEAKLLRNALSDKGFESPEDAERASIPGDEQSLLKKEIEEYDRVLVNIQAQKKLVNKKLKSRTITKEEWEGINSEFTELSEQNQRCVSQSAVAEKRFEELNKKHERWKELGESFKELNHKKGLFEQIQKLLKADLRKDNSFIDYIAQERLKFVAAKASELLGVMTRYRYALELDAEAGFIVRDDANGGAYRVVKSLSGGETFLASFSLALALSEQLQLKGQSPLEFFFLDEGFGTLDSELLNNVIDALERLSSKDRVIGLISHIPELRSRICRRLIVEPPALQGDGSKVKIEKA